MTFPSRPPVYSGVDGKPPTAFVFGLQALQDQKPVAAGTGPDGGISEVISLVSGGLAKIDFARQTDFTYGASTSLYDVTSKGLRAGDPIADCFCSVSYEHHTLLAVADGVGWGEPSRRAARCAVLGAMSHLHRELQGGKCMAAWASMMIDGAWDGCMG